MANDTDEAASKRARRAEPITRRTAKNGSVAYTFQLDIGVRHDGSRERQRFTLPTLTQARREYRRISTDVAAGTFVKRNPTTVASSSWDGWMADVISGPIRSRAIEII